MERAADVFTRSPSVVDLEELHAKIGQLTLEKDFLQGALSKPAIFTKVGNIGICNFWGEILCRVIAPIERCDDP